MSMRNNLTNCSDDVDTASCTVGGPMSGIQTSPQSAGACAEPARSVSPVHRVRGLDHVPLRTPHLGVQQHHCKPPPRPPVPRLVQLVAGMFPILDSDPASLTLVGLLAITTIAVVIFWGPPDWFGQIASSLSGHRRDSEGMTGRDGVTSSYSYATSLMTSSTC